MRDWLLTITLVGLLPTGTSPLLPGSCTGEMAAILSTLLKDVEVLLDSVRGILKSAVATEWNNQSTSSVNSESTTRDESSAELLT